MGRLPLQFTGDPVIDTQLRLIDEQLSELYSQHGQLATRGGILTGGSAGSSLEGVSGPVLIDQGGNGTKFGVQNKGMLFAPTADVFYPDLKPMAWGHWESGGSNLTGGFNLSAVKTSNGHYTYTFITNAATKNYAVVTCGVDSNVPGTNEALVPHYQIVDRTSFTVSFMLVQITAVPDASSVLISPHDCDHSVVVFGSQLS